MRIKTFYAPSMAEALRKVKSEFGRDALIIATREKNGGAAPGFRPKAAVEVVAAVDVENAAGWEESRLPGSAPVAEAAESRQEPCTYSPSWLVKSRESLQSGVRMDREYNEMRRILHSLNRPPTLSAASFPDAASYELYQDLVANEVSEWLAFKMLDEARLALPPEGAREQGALRRSVAQVARRLLPAGCGADGLPGKRMVAFVGPTGVGKTTALAKLGARLALLHKKSVLLLTTDTFRIGAVEQLRTYAGLMGLPFRFVQHIADMPRALEESGQRDYVLIDTPGRGQRDLESAAELTDFLRRTPDIERHLVLSATTKSVDMHEIVDRFAVCRPDRLLFTKLDETSTLGPVFNELVRTQKPLSYLSDGQRVPEDLHVPRADQLVDILLNTH